MHQGATHDGTKGETLAFEAKVVSLSVCTNPSAGGNKTEDLRAFGNWVLEEPFYSFPAH